MKKICLFLVCAGLMLWSCSPSSGQPSEPAENPFFAEFDTPFQTPPFQNIREEHFMPAFLEGMKQHKTEIDAIVNNSEPPTFENTLVTMEYSGLLLDKVGNVFSCLNGAKTNDEIQKMIQKEGKDFKLEAWDWWYYAEKLGIPSGSDQVLCQAL
jgi:peptidyl-dipeptidase Dcp